MSNFNFHKKALIPFITGGDPDIETTEKLTLAMIEAGADMIKIGVPFSDPVAESVTVQKASERALANGCTVDKLFEMVKNIRKNHATPIIFMTYTNLIFVYGKEKFMKNCQEAGINGLVVPDLPFEEKQELDPTCRKFGIALIPLVFPSSKERASMIANGAEGFVYYIPSPAITKTEVENVISEIRKTSQLPVVISYNLKSPADVAPLAAANGIIIDSAVVEIIAKHRQKAVPHVAEYVRRMKI
ncbi:MAG: tryptophan synthase subunit alpha [Defluviitaleaceae bacterium]|nr:tryptophan synthase subunit alpha [Defluviitaleaceae bacterium]